jgi:hypothetical protein
LRWLCLFAIPVFLSGCAMPAAFTVASLALDTGSYVMSGKTLTDHGLSLAMEEDCSMVRLLDEDDAICEEEQDYEVAESLTPLPEGAELEIYLASGDESGDGKGYARLAERVYKARTVYAQLAERAYRARTVYRQLAGRAHKARADHTRYLAAGMMDSEG